MESDMSVKFRKGKFVVDSKWPDGLRTRFRRTSQEKAQELDLRIRLAMLDGSWPGLRASLEMPDEPGKLVSGLFRDIADLYYRDYVATHNRSAKSKKSFLDRFKAALGRLPFRGIALQHVDTYIAKRKKDGLKNASVNREVSTLRHLFEWGMKRGYVSCNPIAQVEKLEEQEWAGPRPTEDVVQAVFAKLDPRLLPVYVVIRETGARRGEVLSLQRWQIDRARQIVTFAKRTKNGKTTTAPLTQKALEAIDSVPELAGCPYVFYNPETGTRWYDARAPWEKARTEAGYPWLRVRDLRPAFGIEVSEMGVPMHFIQSVFGHSSVSVTEKYYAKFSPHAAARAVLTTVEAGRKNQSLAQPVAQEE